MKVGIPKEVKVLEFRVGMVPAGVRELVHDGHDVFVETNAGAGIGRERHALPEVTGLVVWTHHVPAWR